MNLSAYRDLYRRFGVGAVAQSATMALLGKLVEAYVLRVYALERVDAVPVPPGIEIRILSAEELERYADAPGLELPRFFLAEAIPNGDVCVAAFVDGKLSAYGWYATRPARFSNGFTAECASAYVYAYKDFTIPEARGRSLQRLIKAFVVEHFARQGKRGVVAAIDITNHVSRRAFESTGPRLVGRYLIVRAAGRVLSLGSPGSKRVGFRQYKTA